MTKAQRLGVGVGGWGFCPAGALWPQHSTTRCLWPGPHPAPSTVRCFQGSLRADSSPGVAPVLWGRVALPRDFTRCSPAVHAGPARHPASKNDPFCCSALSWAFFLSLPLRSDGSFDLDSWAHCSSKPPPRLVATALPRGALNWPLWGPQASGNPHTGVKWSLQGHSGHEGPSAGGPWAPLRHPPLREKGGGVLQVGVWGHHTDPALECSSEQEGGRGGVSAHPVCSAPPVPVCAGSSVTVAFKDEQAVGLRSLLAWVVLTQPGGELWPNQGRACTPLVAVSEGHLPVTSRGRRKWAGQPTETPKPSSLPPVSSHCPGLHRLRSACLRPSTQVQPRSANRRPSLAPTGALEQGCQERPAGNPLVPQATRGQCRPHAGQSPRPLRASVH